MVWNREKILGSMQNVLEVCTLHAGIKLNIFTILSKTSMTIEQLGQNLGINQNKLSLLLNALVAIKLLHKKDEKYFNTEEAEKYLSKNSEDYLGYIILHHANLIQAWGSIDQAIITGQPTRQRKNNKEEIESFLMGMFNLASGLAPLVSKEIDFGNSTKLLDLGGGPATYSIFFCKNYPQLKATVFDLPTTQEYAQKMINKFAMSGRINFVSGNFLTDEIPGEYDAVWISHILHAQDEQECQRIINKAVNTLQSKGRIFIQDFVLDESKTNPVFPALFALNMLVNTQQGRSYTRFEIKSMLARAGIEQVQKLPITLPNGTAIIMGVKE